jgi:hypothetical protein
VALLRNPANPASESQLREAEAAARALGDAASNPRGARSRGHRQCLRRDDQGTGERARGFSQTLYSRTSEDRSPSSRRRSVGENSFDVALSVTVMEDGDVDRMLTELVRVTKPGGRVAAIVLWAANRTRGPLCLLSGPPSLRRLDGGFLCRLTLGTLAAPHAAKRRRWEGPSGRLHGTDIVVGACTRCEDFRGATALTGDPTEPYEGPLLLPSRSVTSTP